MPTTTPTILDQISAEKTKISGRLARLDADRATVATQLTDLETAERVLTRVSKTPPARRSTSTTATEARASTATGRGRPPKAAANKSAERKPSGPSLRRACSCPGHRQNPTGTICGMSQRSARTMSAWRYSAISARDGSRSATANSTRHRPQRSRHTRQPDPGSSKRHHAVLNWFKHPFPGQEILRISVGITGVLGERSQVG